MPQIADVNPISSHDERLRFVYEMAQQKSRLLPENQRLIMYDPHDQQEVSQRLGKFIKRLDSRRGSKPAPVLADKVLVCTPLDMNNFNFTKIKNPEERLCTMKLAGREYDMLTNKFPICKNHVLMVARDLVPQQLNYLHIQAVMELLSQSNMYAYFNSWGAASSVNHMHIHVIDERPPILDFSLEPKGVIFGQEYFTTKNYPGKHYVLAAGDLDLIAEIVTFMQKENQPHNVFFTSTHIYIFPRTLSRSARQKTIELYGEKVGGLEFAGIFTVYSKERFKSLTYNMICELLRMNSAPLEMIPQVSSSESLSNLSTDASSCDSDTMEESDDSSEI